MMRTYELLTRSVRLAVTEWGDPAGRPMVLQHGLGSSTETWNEFAETLSDEYRVISWDLRGHGASEKPGSGYLTPHYAADLQNAIDALELDRPYVVGHSLGALVAMTWEITYPGEASGMVLEDPPTRTSPEIQEAVHGWTQLNQMPVDQVAAYYQGEHPEWTPEQCLRAAVTITSVHPAVYREIGEESVRSAQDTEQTRLRAMATISVPLLVVHGEESEGSMTYPEDLALFVSLAPNARLAPVEGVGHSVHRDSPEMFAEEVRAFGRTLTN